MGRPESAVTGRWGKEANPDLQWLVHFGFKIKGEKATGLLAQSAALHLVLHKFAYRVQNGKRLWNEWDPLSLLILSDTFHLFALILGRTSSSLAKLLPFADGCGRVKHVLLLWDI